MEKNIEFKVIPPTEENIILLENLRFDAYGFNTNIIDMNLFHANELKNGHILVFGCTINDELVAACYITSTYNSLFVENLFVKRALQGSGLKLGRKLLCYINLNKKLLKSILDVN